LCRHNGQHLSSEDTGRIVARKALLQNLFDGTGNARYPALGRM
jgi:hypothetical protein